MRILVVVVVAVVVVIGVTRRGRRQRAGDSGDEGAPGESIRRRIVRTDTCQFADMDQQRDDRCTAIASPNETARKPPMWRPEMNDTADGASGGLSVSAAAAPRQRNERRVLIALLLTGGFMTAEVAGGLISGSLALLADAGHMLTDTAALALAYLALRAARAPETTRHTFGRHRLQVLAALINGTALFAITIWIAIEAVNRFMQPVEILGGSMMVIAVLGLLINLASFLILRPGSGTNMNVRGAALHAMGDMLGSVGAIVAAGVILLTGWMPIDPILSVLVCLLILRSARGLVRDSWNVLMERAPADMEIEAIRDALIGGVPGLTEVHHVHLWSLTPEQPVVTLHGLVQDDADRDAVLFAIKTMLRDRLGLDHAAVQLEGSRFRALLAEDTARRQGTAAHKPAGT